MGANHYEEAFRYVSEACSKALDKAMGSDEIVCMMCEDADNLGAALVSHFLLTKTKKTTKLSASKAIEKIRERRLQVSILR